MAGNDANDDLAPWTAEARAQVRQTGKALLEAIRRQLTALESADANADTDELDRIGRAVDTASVAFSDSQLALTGEYFSLSEVTDEWDEEIEDDEDNGEPEDVLVISVLQRAEYHVVDSEAVIAAARASYLRTWESDTEADAAERIQGLGTALYEIAHADGWDSLIDTPGLSPAGRIVNVIEPAEPIDLGDEEDVEEEEPNSTFGVRGRLLHAQFDHWQH